MDLRPHIMHWRTLDGEATESPEGYPVPGTPGEERLTPCRYHDSIGSGKVYRNEDSTEYRQSGSIRCDAGAEVPQVGMLVRVMDGAAEVFSGTVREIFRGQLSTRIEV